jgi:tetratricopeptide (TPR) repeat protein
VLCVPFVLALLLAWPYLMPADPNVDPDAPRAWFFIPSAGFGLEGVTPWQYLLTQFGVIVWYLRLFILPTRQCFDYGWPFVDSIWRSDVLLPLTVLVGLAAAALLAYRRYPLATFCVAWVFITLAPTSTIVPLRDAAFEHRMYLPIVGLAWLVIVGGYDLLGWLARRRGTSAAALRRAGAALAAAWIILLAVATLTRNTLMQDPIALAADSTAKAPANWRAHSNYAEALLAVGHNAEAMPALEEAIRLNPRAGSARVQLGQLYLRAGRLDDAEAVLTPATEELEESVAAAAYQQLATVYERRGDSRNTVELLRAAVERKPEWANVQAQLAAAYGRVGFWYGEAGHYNTALRLNPRLVATLGGTAAAANLRAAQNQLEEGKPDNAERLLAYALRYRPDDLNARHFLAVVHASAGNWDRALAQLEALRQSLPNDALLRDNIERAHNHEPLVPPPLG